MQRKSKQYRNRTKNQAVTPEMGKTTENLLLFLFSILFGVKKRSWAET